MKDILIALGGIFGFFLFVVAVLVVTIIILIKIYFPKVKRFFSQQAEAFQRAVTESQEFAHSTVVAVLGNWDADVLVRCATPQLLETIAGGDLSTLFTPWKQSLGRFISCGEIAVKENFSAGGGLPGDTWNIAALATATYAIEAQFDRGTAVVEIQIVKQGGVWLTNTFNLLTNEATLYLGVPTTLEALQKRELQTLKLEGTIDVPVIDPEQ